MKPSHLRLSILCAAALFLSRCTNPYTPVVQEESPVVDEEQSALAGPDIVGGIWIDTADYEMLEADGLTKSAAPMGVLYKWHYRNIILPDQAGKLYWCVKTGCKDRTDYITLITNAFKKWAPYVPFTFVRTTTLAQANIVIDFNNEKAFLDQNKLDKVWWTSLSSVILGYAYGPHETTAGLGLDFRGDIYINDRYVNWKNDTTAPGTILLTKPAGDTVRIVHSLYRVLIHEIGHALGLRHDNVSLKNMMASTASMNPADTVLWDSDIKSIAQIYDAPYYLTFGPDIAMFEVRDVYNRILGRQPTSTELSKYKARLLFNRVPSLRNYDSRTFVAEIAGLAEHRNRFGADTSLFIDSLYLKTLYVLPTKAAKDTCLNLMRAGVKADSVARYAVYSLAWAKTWVKAAYLQHMDAVLSTTTTSTLALKIVNGTQTPEETVYAWLKSAGYFALCDPQDNSGLITRLYTTLTGVAPTSSQLSFWMNWIN